MVAEQLKERDVNEEYQGFSVDRRLVGSRLVNVGYMRGMK